MPSNQEEYQRELYQLFAQSGEVQFMLRAFRKAIEDKNSELNTLNQKIEKTQVNFRNFLEKSKQPVTPSEEVAVASPDQDIKA